MGVSGDGFNGYYPKLVFHYDISDLSDLYAMRQFCIDNNRTEAAALVSELIEDAEKFRAKVARFGGVIRAIAYTEDGDSGIGYIDDEVTKLGETTQNE